MGRKTLVCVCWSLQPFCQFVIQLNRIVGSDLMGLCRAMIMTWFFFPGAKKTTGQCTIILLGRLKVPLFFPHPFDTDSGPANRFDNG